MHELLGEAVTVEALERLSYWLKPWLWTPETWRAEGLQFEAVAVNTREDRRPRTHITLIR